MIIFTLLFIWLMFMLIKLAVAMAWGLTKILFNIIFIPVCIIGVAIAGSAIIGTGLVILLLIGAFGLMASNRI